MNTIAQTKEKIINDYISLINLDGEINTNKIAEELAIALSEKPGVELNYDTDIQINEDMSQKRTSKLKSINIYYTYEEGNQLRFGKKTYIIA